MESNKQLLLPVYCMDGRRKGRLYYWPAGTREFQVSTVFTGSAEDVYNGGRMSGYGGLIYKIYMMWGTGVLVAYFQRYAYK